MEADSHDLGWWTISGNALLDLLHRAYNGEDPDMLYAEEYANSERDYPAMTCPPCKEGRHKFCYLHRCYCRRAHHKLGGN